MKSIQVQEYLVECINQLNFDAPYGVLTGEQTNKNGRTYLSITFGRKRTLDAELRIFGEKFILLRTSRDRNDGNYLIFRSLDELVQKLKTL